ncbi:hypothetical protein MXD81_17610, partial [Microbacteriaceae bacterium K1510]|nr:hypothetical protein [Microbacteriaceae bacterium K1510]
VDGFSLGEVFSFHSGFAPLEGFTSRGGISLPTVLSNSAVPPAARLLLTACPDVSAVVFAVDLAEKASETADSSATERPRFR